MPRDLRLLAPETRLTLGHRLAGTELHMEVDGSVSVQADPSVSNADPSPRAMPIVVRSLPETAPRVPARSASALDRLAGGGVRVLLLGVDLLAAATGVLVGVGIVSHEVPFDSPARKIAAFALILLALHWTAGLYRPRLSLSVLDDVPVLAGRWLAAVGLAVLAQIAWSKAIWQDYIIDWRFLWGAVVTGAGVLVLRAAGYLLIRRLRSRPSVPHSTLILGAGGVGHDVARILVEHPEYGLHPIGFLDDDPRIPARSSLPVLGGLQELSRILERHDVRNVVVAFSSHKESRMVAVIRECDREKCELFVVPRLFELQHGDDERTHAWGVPLVRLRRATHRSPAWRVKRLLDVLVSGVLLLLMAPLLLLIALAVRLDSGPGIIFRQQRVGVDGRTFDLLKFRSLPLADERDSATTWNVSQDSRLSWVARFLREHSLDELPQLFNILRGDMSLVGPRPERPHFVEQFRALYPSYEARHRVPSGLTGWAQVHGLRGDTSIAERARFDNYYIENWSLWLDVKILLRSVTSVLRPAGG
jgi:exopolysaccharide biosynthesis polyprenyl glycosylphosphotransferase